jgi:hypothetical protein
VPGAVNEKYRVTARFLYFSDQEDTAIARRDEKANFLVAARARRIFRNAHK